MDFTKLTPDQVNALVAERVMGWTVCRDVFCEGCDSDISVTPKGTCTRMAGDGDWSPMTSPTDACEVWDRLVADGWSVDIARVPGGFDACAVMHKPVDSINRIKVCKLAPTWPAALCMAALEAMERTGK